MRAARKINRLSAVNEPLDKIVEHLEEEARMVLPGIQALFGFQLIAVFNQRFIDLSQSAQSLHFLALLLVAVSVLLVLTPAAYHRQVEPDRISPRLCNMGSILLTWALLPLALATSIDVFVIGTLIVSPVVAVLTATGTFIALMMAWFGFPQILRRKEEQKARYNNASMA